MSRVRILSIAQQFAPPVLLDAFRRLKGKRLARREPYRDALYQGVRTSHNAKPLHIGRFAEVYDRHLSLDPHLDGDWMRYRIYNECVIAQLCSNVPGDFICAGVSWGLAPRMIYDYVAFSETGKTFHLIDPFEGIWSASSREAVPFYNTDPEYVRRQYPTAARIKFHRKLIPDAFPLPGVEKIAFAMLNTGDEKSEALSLPILFDALSEQGMIVIGRYGSGDGHFDVYDPVLTKLGVEPFWLPSGQAVITKR